MQMRAEPWLLPYICGSTIPQDGRVTPPGHEPDVLAGVRRELSDWRRWLERGTVLAYAALAGLAVVAFTALSEQALHAFSAAQARVPWLPLVWTPLVAAAVTAVTLRWLPGAGGSGIPQVMAALSPAVPAGALGLFASLRLALAKVVLVSAGLLGGLALGREGPAVQIGAGIMLHARRWLPGRSAVTAHGLLVAGGAAGVAAVFNAPLAGVMFAIEQLSRQVEERTSGLIIGAIVLAGVVAVSIYGNATYFGVIRAPALALEMVWPGVLVVLACGLAGGVFSRLLLASLVGGGRLCALRQRRPMPFAAACGFAVALIGVVTGGATFGSGYDYTQALLAGDGGTPGLVVLLRSLATWLSVWSGVPGGVVAPSMAIGAGIGHDVAQLAGVAHEAPVFIALGMAAFLAAVTQAPLTAFIIVMEMVDGHAMVLTLMAAALGANAIARLISRPLFATLAQDQLARLP